MENSNSTKPGKNAVSLLIIVPKPKKPQQPKLPITPKKNKKSGKYIYNENEKPTAEKNSRI